MRCFDAEIPVEVPFLAVRLRSERDGRISTSVRSIGDIWVVGYMNDMKYSAVNVLMTSRSYLGLGFLGILSQLGDRSVACIGSPATQKRSVLFNEDPDYAIPDLSAIAHSHASPLLRVKSGPANRA